MTLRRTFLALVVPLFLLLAGVNGALLYVWEKGEAAHGLREQALSAAVTAAAFAEQFDDLARALAEPGRAAALRAADANIKGLDGLFLVSPGGAWDRLAGSGAPPKVAPPAQPSALPIARGPNGRPVAIASAPAGRGRFVIAEIDARPLYAEVATLKRLIGAVVVAAGLIGFVLAWLVAGRVARELAQNNAMIAAIRDGAASEPDRRWAIRETRDLADAVRLMRTAVAGRRERGERELAMRERLRDEAAAAAAVHAAAFPAFAGVAAGQAIATRLLGEAPPGAFYAVCRGEDRAALALGICQGDAPASALADAQAARRFLERALLGGDPEARIAEACAAFGIERCVWTAWTADAAPADRALAALLGDDSARAVAFADTVRGLSPSEVFDDLEALLEARGVAAVLRPASGEGGQA